MKTELVEAKNKDVYTNSLIVAEKLEVNHKDLLRTIEKITKKQGAGQHIVNSQRFIQSEFKNKMGRTYPMYLMNEQAFSKLVMNLSGYAKAEEIQDMFIEAFFRMKDALLRHQNVSWIEKSKETKQIRAKETDVIQDFVEYATAQGSTQANRYYENITKMTNKALELLIQSEHGKPIRQLATILELGFIQVVDNRAMQVIQDGMDRKFPYKEIYVMAKEEVNKLVDSLCYKRLE
jgi:Rha family phage regulatory protein